MKVKEKKSTVLGIVHLGASDLGKDLLYIGRRAVNKGLRWPVRPDLAVTRKKPTHRSRVDNGLNTRDSGSQANEGFAPGGLPESAGRVDRVELNVARVQVIVGAAEVQLRAAAGEVETELVGVDDAGCVGVDEERVLVEVGDGGERQAEDAE